MLVSDLGRLSLYQRPDLSSDRREIRFVGEDSVVNGLLCFFQSVHQLHIGCSISIYLGRESIQARELNENPLGLGRGGSISGSLSFSFSFSLRFGFSE